MISGELVKAQGLVDFYDPGSPENIKAHNHIKELFESQERLERRMKRMMATQRAFNTIPLPCDGLDNPQVPLQKL